MIWNIVCTTKAALPFSGTLTPTGNAASVADACYSSMRDPIKSGSYLERHGINPKCEYRMRSLVH
jgi:hypothetical protein